MIIVGYQGIGKSSTVAEDRRHRFIDLESSNFWIHKKRDPEWFMIYGNIADDLSKQGFIVFVSSHAAVRNYIASISCERKVIICPSLGLKDEWIDRLKNRYEQEPTNKNYKAFMNAVDRFDDNIKELLDTTGYEKFTLSSINYKLSDFIDSYIL